MSMILIWYDSSLLSSFTDHLIACCLILWQNVGLVCLCVCLCVCLYVCPPSSLSSSPLPVCQPLLFWSQRGWNHNNLYTIGTGFPLQYKFWVPNQTKKTREQKPNSWTSNFDEVSGHNLESYQTWGFCLQSLHYKPVSRGGGEGVSKIH